MRPERLQIGTRESIALDVAERVAALAEAAVAARGVFTIAIAGGSVAEACLPTLAGAALPWPAVHIFWCDERAVPVTHRDSNAGQAMLLWKGSRLAAEANVHIMPAHLPGLERAATVYSAEIMAATGGTGVLDVVLLGVGEDGHVASLFPHRRELSNSATPVLAVSDSPKPPPRRLTMSLGMLTGARDTFIIAFGSAKAQSMRIAIDNPVSHLPVAQVIRGANHAHILLDSAAASALSETPPTL